MAEAEQFVEEVPEEEEEEEDPQDVLKEKCSEISSCSKLREVFDECEESAEGTSRNCTQQLMDFVHCVDHCVSKNLFSKLK